MIELAGTYSLSDLVRFQYFHFNRRRWWISAVALIFPLLGLSLAILLVVVEDTDSQLLHNTLPFIGLLILWTMIILGGPYLSSRRQLKNTPFLQEQFEFRFDSEGVHMKGPTFSSDITWNHVQDIYETKSNFLVYLSPQLAWVVPKRLFAGEAEIESMRSLSKAHVSNPRVFHEQNWLSSLF